MKKENKFPEEDDMLPEYDLKGKKAVRGKYYLGPDQAHTVQIEHEDGTITEQRFHSLGKPITLEPDEDGMLPEYDFSGKTVVRGKHAKTMHDGYTVTIHNEDGTTTVKRYGPMIRLDPDIFPFFPDAESVNNALRSLIKPLTKKQVGEKKAKYTVRKKTAKPPAARK